MKKKIIFFYSNFVFSIRKTFIIFLRICLLLLLLFNFVCPVLCSNWIKRNEMIFATFYKCVFLPILFSRYKYIQKKNLFQSLSCLSFIKSTTFTLYAYIIVISLYIHIFYIKYLCVFLWTFSSFSFLLWVYHVCLYTFLCVFLLLLLLLKIVYWNYVNVIYFTSSKYYKIYPFAFYLNNIWSQCVEGFLDPFILILISFFFLLSRAKLNAICLNIYHLDCCCSHNDYLLYKI